jgi:hypothetical protein
MCGKAWERQHTINMSTHSENKWCKQARKRVAQTISVANMHELGRNFVEEVLDVEATEARTAEDAAKGHHLQFKCQSEDGRKRHTRKYELFC